MIGQTSIAAENSAPTAAQAGDDQALDRLVESLGPASFDELAAPICDPGLKLGLHTAFDDRRPVPSGSWLERTALSP